MNLIPDVSNEWRKGEIESENRIGKRVASNWGSEEVRLIWE